jgi:CubicO group peptidase (beta-lactamase class C family)
LINLSNNTACSSVLVLGLIFISSCGENVQQNSSDDKDSLKKEALHIKLLPEHSGETDPVEMGWMQGYPPPKDKRLAAADGSFFRFPALRYSTVHMREFLPTINVSRGLEDAARLSYDIDQNIDTITFLPWNDSIPMTWEESLQANYTDGMLILHRRKILYEKYFGEMAQDRVHAVMSVSKTFTGTLAAILVAEGILDENALVKDYVPELEGSAFGDATVREVMDMTTALQFSENYADPKAEIWAFSAAGNPSLSATDYDGPVGYFEYLETVKKSGEHGEIFGYKTVNTDALGWVISRVSNKKVSELLSERIWQPLGMEMDAYYQVDGLGTPFAGGGLSAGLRDLARFGEMIRNNGIWNGEQIIPKSAVDDIQKGGNREAFANSIYGEKLKGWSYRNMWWMTHNEHDAFAARGVHGQTIYIDPVAEMVLVRLASHPSAANSKIDPTSLPAYHAVAKYLKSKNDWK